MSDIIDADHVWIDEPAPNLIAKFNQAIGAFIPNIPMQVGDFDTDDFDLLWGLIKEEYKETAEAVENRDLLGFIDGLQDLKYVIYGLELRMGIASEEHFAEVHAANMRKLEGEPVWSPEGKRLKPEGWVGPDHQAVIDQVVERGCIYA